MIIKCEQTLGIVVSLEDICIKNSTAIWMLKLDEVAEKSPQQQLKVT
jgi:hypothetical protein